jgi:predicted DNA-binding transcriptional regulator YafY
VQQWTVEPILLILKRGALHLQAWCPESELVETFALTRMQRVRRLPESFKPRAFATPEFAAEPVFSVRVRVARDQAALLDRYPLDPRQQLALGPSGDVIVTAEVPLEDATRWVLGWGRAATVLEPRGLVAGVKKRKGRH